MVTLRWAARSRVVLAPSSARSVRIVFKRSGASDYVFVQNRRDDAAAYTETVTIPQKMATGRVDVEYRFCADTGGAGDTVAVAFASASLTGSGEGLDTVTTEGNVSSVSIPSGQSITVGQTANLAVQVLDAQGRTLAVSPGSIFLTSDAPTVLAITSTGAQGLVRGTANVRATLDGHSSAATTVRVTNVPALRAVGAASAPANTFDCILSGDGTVVYGFQDGDAGIAPFTWTATTGVNTLTTAAGFTDFIPRATNTDGTVVVGSVLNSQLVRRAVLWNPNGLGSGSGTFTTLGTLNNNASYQSDAVALSADGSVIVGQSDSDLGPQAFVWRQGSAMLGLGDFSTPDDDISDSRATAVSADGKWVVGQARLGDAARRGFAWSSGTGLREIGAVVTPDAPTVEVRPTLVAPNGDVFGVADDLAWKWSGGFSSVLPAVGFVPTAAGGNAIFGSAQSVPAAMWTPEGGLQNLSTTVQTLGLTSSLAGFTINGVYGASRDGSRVLLAGAKPDGTRATFLLTLP